MAVTLQLAHDRSVDLVGFAWSPLFEAVLSLPVVVNPKRSPMHLPWARRCRSLPQDLLDEIRTLAGTFDGFVPGIFEVGLSGDSPTFADELAALAALPDDLVAYEVSLTLGGLGCHPPEGHGPDIVGDRTYRDAVIAAAAREGTTRAALARQAFADPGALRERYAALLTRYWEAAFQQEWERVLPRIEAEVTAGARTLVTRGMPGLVAQLLPEGHWDAQSARLVVDKTWEDTCDVAARGGMLLVPTVYGWPRVLMELSEPWPLSIFVPLRDMRRPEVPSTSDREVADALRALGDETRLQIARLVAAQPRSTKELAQLLAVSDSAVSRHLKILDAAGLVDRERDGYFVLYRLRSERIGQVGGALRHALGLAQATPDEVPPLPVTLARGALIAQRS